MLALYQGLSNEPKKTSKLHQLSHIPGALSLIMLAIDFLIGCNPDTTEVPILVSSSKETVVSSTFRSNCDLYSTISYVCDLLTGECKKGILYRKAGASKKSDKIAEESVETVMLSLSGVVEICQHVSQEEIELFVQKSSGTDTQRDSLNSVPRFFYPFALLNKLALLYSISCSNPDLLMETFARLASLIKATIPSAQEPVGAMGVSGYLDMNPATNKQMALSLALEKIYCTHLRSLVVFSDAMKAAGRNQHIELLEKIAR